MKSLIASICILGLVGMVVGMVAQADETVTATVTPQTISVSVTDGSVDYGILAIYDTNNTFDGAATTDTQTITNTSNVSANMALRSSDAAKTGAPDVTDWALAAAISTDVFVHSYDVDAVTPTWTAFPFDGTFDNTYTSTVVTLGTTVGTDDTATLDLKIDMPDSISDTTIHSITVTVLVTES